MGVDDVGVAAMSDYRSPKSLALDTIFPSAKSIVVMAYRSGAPINENLWFIRKSYTLCLEFLNKIMV